MDIGVPKGKYIIAVSGGVDSMVLLDLLAGKKNVELVVAHFNHGMRDGAAADEKFVRSAAKRLNLPFEAGYGRLGKDAGEDTARKVRYDFLYKMQEKHEAKAIITAHHQDDLIETALLNLSRGSGRRGMVAMSANDKVMRPLLGYSKQKILDYAQKHDIGWREDETNSQDIYLRNTLRKELKRRLTQRNREEIIKRIEKVAKTDNEIDQLIAKISQILINDDTINRELFTLLPVEIGDELVVYWMRQQGVRDYDRKTVNRINMALRTFKGGTTCSVKSGLRVDIDKKTAQFSTTV